VLIVFDRLFGSFKPLPDEVLRYGLSRAEKEPDFSIVFAGWTEMIAAFRRAETWPGRLGAMFGRPV